MSFLPDVGAFRFAEPIEAVEQALVARENPRKVNVFGHGFDDFPVRLSVFDVALQVLSGQMDTCAKDENFQSCFPSSPVDVCAWRGSGVSGRERRS